MRNFFLIASTASLILGAEILLMSPGSAQEGDSSEAINAKSLCGTWQAIAGSGGAHQLTTASGNGMLKISKQDSKGDSVKYTIADASSRTAMAVQTINMKKGPAFHIGDGFKTNAVRKLIGVTTENKILFAVQGESNTEIWTPSTQGVYNVAGIETGPNAMAYYYKIKQTSKSTCKAD
jgi:hypothetical protein